MIIAWVFSLVVLLASLTAHIEKLISIELIRVNSMIKSQEKFIANEKALQECQDNLLNMAAMANVDCHLQSAGKNLWLISNMNHPKMEVLVFLDERTHEVTRLNWRQRFD